jgi:hypothetical protein
MANPVAVPGTSVPSSSLVTPGGAQGTQGIQGPIGPNAVSTDAGNIATLGSDNLLLVPQSSIWNVRLRSFNAIGNPNSDVDQRNAGTTIASAVGGSFACDRWRFGRSGTATFQCSIGQQMSTWQNAPVVPGTNFATGHYFTRITLTTQQATLGASDFFQLYQLVEGPTLRELSQDVHSVALLVRSTVANLTFTLFIGDSPATWSLLKLCTIPTANTWTLIPLPNLPIWPATGNFALAPGNLGYQFVINLGAGTTYQSSTQGVWQNAAYYAVTGQSNFAASPVNSTFDVAFCQHEPGSVCSQLMDLPFSGPNGNLQACQRYYQKSYPYAVKPGTAGGAGAMYAVGFASINNWAGVRFPVTMAKTPTMTAYATSNGAINSADVSGSVLAGTINLGIGDSGFGGFGITSVPAANYYLAYHWTADTGW